MAYVVAEPCIKCKYTDCVAVCPVDCFYEGEDMLAINPDECIDCGVCEAECPATAIFSEADLPAKWDLYKGVNAVFSGARRPDQVDTTGWPERVLAAAQDIVWQNISEQKDPLPGADDLKEVQHKLELLSGAGQP